MEGEIIDKYNVQMIFGKYKGQYLRDIYRRNPKYIYWLSNIEISEGLRFCIYKILNEKQ